MKLLELVTYDPADPNTYPSVCNTPQEVEHRFGFKGGETLVFDGQGNYKGELTKMLEDDE